MVPLRMGHCATMTERGSATCMRQRATSLVGLAFMPKGCSERMAPPFSTISSCKDLFALGWVMSNPEATMAKVGPPASRQPRWATVSHPNANPLITTWFCSPICRAKWYTVSCPCISAARAPMMATQSSRWSNSLFPDTWIRGGASLWRTHSFQIVFYCAEKNTSLLIGELPPRLLAFHAVRDDLGFVAP